MRGKFILAVLAAALLGGAPGRALAGDWPQFMGPTRNGVYHGPALSTQWGAAGPKVVWTKKTGQGFSSPVVAGGKVVLFHRVGAEEWVEGLDAVTGKDLWRYAYPCKFKDGVHFDDGPRATPALADGKVYTFGAEGMLSCVALADGAKIWSVDTKAEYKTERSWYGMVSAPLVEGNAVMVNVGSTNQAGIVAFDKNTGSVLWQATSDRWSGAAPVGATIQGEHYALFLTRSRLVGLTPADGKIRFEYPWTSRDYGAVIASSPVVVNDSIFLSAIYSMGSTLLRVKNGAVKKQWASKEIATHYQTAIYQDGFLYAPDGHQSEHPELCCVEFATGKVRWRNREFGAVNVTLANGDLVLLTHLGELVIGEASPKEFKVKARGQILSSMVRAYPAIADGFLYGRGTGKLVGVDLRGK